MQITTNNAMAQARTHATHAQFAAAMGLPNVAQAHRAKAQAAKAQAQATKAQAQAARQAAPFAAAMGLPTMGAANGTPASPNPNRGKLPVRNGGACYGHRVGTAAGAISNGIQGNGATVPALAATLRGTVPGWAAKPAGAAARKVGNHLAYLQRNGVALAIDGQPAPTMGAAKWAKVPGTVAAL